MHCIVNIIQCNMIYLIYSLTNNNPFYCRKISRINIIKDANEVYHPIMQRVFIACYLYKVQI